MSAVGVDPSYAGWVLRGNSFAERQWLARRLADDGFAVISDGGVGVNPGPSWKIKDAGDFNGDGKSDILWQNDNGAPAIWLMDGFAQLGGRGRGL